ncbi:MAG: XRE family transcriptional regulator [Ruminococcaceae bacterium]|nr:XRE family transcriptional regulator [Oscillospiraceae bacterium]
MYEKLKKYNYLYNKQERKELIARNIIELRKNARLQQKEVAELLKVQYQTYRNYESGASEPPAEMLVRLSKLYEIPVDIIIGADDYSKDKDKARKIFEEQEREISELRAKVEAEKDEIKKLALMNILNFAENELKKAKNQLDEQ